MTATGWRKQHIRTAMSDQPIERFVLNDLPDNSWSVSWPGYEYVVVDNPVKADNLLKILFNEVGADEAVLAVHRYNAPDRGDILHLSWISWQSHPDAVARHVVDHQIVVGCKFPTLEQAEKFKLIMERRLAWKRLSGGKAWA